MKIHGGEATRNWLAEDGDVCGYCGRELSEGIICYGYYKIPLFCSLYCIESYLRKEENNAKNRY